MNMMKGRNLIILVGIPGWLYLIWLGGYYYTFFILSAIILGLQEFYELAEKKNATPLRFIGFAIAVFIADYYHVQPEMTAFQFIGIFILIILIIFIWQLFRDTENPNENVALTMKGILYIPVMLGTAIAIRQFDQQMDTHITFALVTSVWACDSAAFILGSLWGSSKIFPRISPNKSWLGSLSGLIAAVLVFYGFQYYGVLGDIFTIKNALIMGLISGIIGQIGDFYESMLKRDAGVKDTGTLLRGHGGILDRFDSLIFATPTMFIYIHFII